MKSLRRLKQSLAALAGPPPEPNWFRRTEKARRLSSLSVAAEALSFHSFPTSSDVVGWSQRELRRQTRRFKRAARKYQVN